jgi:hypothetical protein
MNLRRQPSTDRAWPRLAARVRADHHTLLDEQAPLGFATRVVAQWKTHPREATVALLEWLTMRGLAVAVVILLGSAAFSYDTLLGIFTGETALAGSWFDSLLTL